MNEIRKKEVSRRGGPNTSVESRTLINGALLHLLIGRILDFLLLQYRIRLEGVKKGLQAQTFAVALESGKYPFSYIFFVGP